jgi:hypothetical protein
MNKTIWDIFPEKEIEKSSETVFSFGICDRFRIIFRYLSIS